MAFWRRSGTEQEFSSSLEHLESGANDASFLVYIAKNCPKAVSFFVLRPTPFCPPTSTGSDKYHAVNDLGMLVDETKKPEPQPCRIKRLFGSIKQLAPEVASILSSAA